MIPPALRRRIRQFIERRGDAVLGWALAVGVFVTFIAPLRTTNPCDYYAFWIVGQTIDKVQLNNAYLPSENRAMCDIARAGAAQAPSRLERTWREFQRVIDMVGTPTLFAFYKVISTHDFAHDYERYRLACALIYAAGVLLLARHLRFPPWSLGPLLLFFTFFFWPYRRDIIDTNNSSLLAGSCMLLFTLLGRRSIVSHVIAGAAFGFLAAFKPTVSFAPVFIALVLMSGRPRLFFGFSIAFALGLLGSMVAGQAILGPAMSWKNWSGWSMQRALQIRLLSGGFPGRFLSLDHIWSLQLFLLSVFFAHVVGVLNVSFREEPPAPATPHSPPEGFAAICAGCIGLAAYLFSGPLVWGHYFVLAVPAALVALRPRPDLPDHGRFAMTIGLICSVLISSNPTFMELGWTRMNNYSPFTYTGLLVLSIMAWWDWWREGNGSAPAASNAAV